VKETSFYLSSICGPLSEDEATIKVDGVELDEWRWIFIGTLGEYLVPRLARRLLTAVELRNQPGSGYLEHGAIV
jgi:hypothetical protein